MDPERAGATWSKENLMAYTLATMRTEVFQRGFNYLDDSSTGTARVNRWLNDAAHEIDDMERWDYRRTSTTGTAPLTVSDLGEIESVTDSNYNVLASGDRGVLTSQDGNLTTTGTALDYYIVAGVLKTYPVSTLTLTVNYFKVAPDMTADSDTPLMPDRFRAAIVDRAVAKGYRDSDNPDLAQVTLTESDRLVDRMREVYVLQSGESRQTVMGHSGDW